MMNAYSGEPNRKREDCISWHDYFMATAFLAAKRSKDPRTRVGACIVDENKKIVGIGYNSMPTGCRDEDFPWCRKSENASDNKTFYVCHAEMNAVLNKNSRDVRNCTIYVGLFPCNECAKVIIQAGIKEVIYLSDKHAHKNKTTASKRMLDAAKVEYWQYRPSDSEIVIDFNDIDDEYGYMKQLSKMKKTKTEMKDDVDSPKMKKIKSAETDDLGATIDEQQD